VDQFSPTRLHRHHLQQQQQQQQSGEVQWVVVEPRPDLGHSSDAVAAPAASVTSTPAPVRDAPVEAGYSVPGRSAPVVTQIVKDDSYQDDCVITQRNYSAVSGCIICRLLSYNSIKRSVWGCELENFRRKIS